MPDDRMSRGYARSRERNEAARAALEPLRPGERPRAVTVAAVVSALLALLLFVQAAVGGVDDTDERNGIILFGLVLALAAAGMWRAQYWAVLGFQFFLGLTLVFAGVSLLFAGNLLAVVYCVLILGLAGTLFWYLVKAMARIQMPKVKRPE